MCGHCNTSFVDIFARLHISSAEKKAYQAMSQRPSMLIIDSRAREPNGSLDAFQIRIQPAIEFDIRGVSLLYASIANPDDEAAELYWGIRKREFGLPIRSAANSDSATFIVPVNSAQGFRTLHRAKSDFSRTSKFSNQRPRYTA